MIVCSFEIKTITCDPAPVSPSSLLSSCCTKIPSITIEKETENEHNSKRKMWNVHTIGSCANRRIRYAYILCVASLTNRKFKKFLFTNKKKKEKCVCLWILPNFFICHQFFNDNVDFFNRWNFGNVSLKFTSKKNKSTHSTTITMNWLLKYSLYQIKNKENWNYFFCLWLELHEECELFVDVVYLFLHFLNCFWNDNISNFIKQFDQFICFVLFV